MDSQDNKLNIYHEKQSKELCALHALNNLFQQPRAFLKEELDAICNDLAPGVWINPHKSMLGLGNYGVHVIEVALHKKGYEPKWFDKRKDPDCINLDRVLGFILNVPNDTRFGMVSLPLNRRHWFTLREVDGQYYNLDSKLDAPEVIGTGDQLLEFLRQQANRSKDFNLLVVVDEDTAREQTWLRSKEEL